MIDLKTLMSWKFMIFSVEKFLSILFEVRDEFFSFFGFDWKLMDFRAKESLIKLNLVN